MTKNNRLQRRNSRQFFHETSLARWVLCGRFATKKCDLHGRNSRHFFLRPLLDCLRGSTPHGDHVMYCYDFSSKRFHFETILRSFWAPERSCGPIPGSWDQSGGQGALKAKIPPFFHPLFWDLFWTSFRFGVKICRKSINKSCVCAQCNF